MTGASPRVCNTKLPRGLQAWLLFGTKGLIPQSHLVFEAQISLQEKPSECVWWYVLLQNNVESLTHHVYVMPWVCAVRMLKAVLR